MRRLILFSALLVLSCACEPTGPAVIDGKFSATIPVSGSKTEDCVKWSVGDRVVLSDCSAPVLFEDGEMVESANAECFTVTPEMLSQDMRTIHFETSLPASKKYALLTAGDFGRIVRMGKDGSVQTTEREASTRLNYIASAVSTDGTFNLKGMDNIFTVDVSDRRVKYLIVCAGDAYLELEIDNCPATCYFPLALDEDISDGAYAYAYDKLWNELYDGHFEQLSFRTNAVTALGDFFDVGDAPRNVINEILRDNDEVEATYNLEGEVLNRYLNEVQYDNDYSYTKIKQYVPSPNEPGSVRPAYVSVKDLKDPAKIYFISGPDDIQTRTVTSKDKQTVYNLIPGRTYRYGIVSVDSQTGKETLLKKGCIATEGHLRVIKTRAMHNVRDVGGWEGLDGKHIKYGILIRGGEILDKDDNKNLSKYDLYDYDALVNQVGIDFDLDFRNNGDEVQYFNRSPFGLEFLRIPLSAYDSIVAKKDRQPAFRKAILKFMENAKQGKCTYVHCQGGADRTGTFVFFIEGLLGVSDSDLCKDYEITSFYYHKERNDPERYLPMVQALLSKFSKDGTVGNGILNCAKSMGFTDSEIQELRDLMLE